ncbi:helix-turn-helix transcriptional regulator [Candidatus Hecatella orcuttiae]|uniref:helix-turn-helix transcriptional regulator n=1 Tax=Candidatus Hecatella orcuttiae TaxID=1935119 RepID=UPI002867BE4B|nr:ArsR family transcriptional regulator [Candidatus Hecatella orcuttiae]
MSLEKMDVKETEVHRALSVEPRRQVLGLLASYGPLSLEDLSRKTGLKTITLRHHMRILENTGLVESFLKGRDGPGRPTQLYTIVSRYVNLSFPKRQYEMLTQHLLEFLLKKKGEKYTVSILREIGAKLGEQLMKNLSFQYGIQRWDEDKFSEYVLPEIAKMGSYPSLTKRADGSLEIRISNCIFYEVAKANPKIVCEGHKAFFQTIANYLGKYEAVNEYCIAEGNRHCITILKNLEAARKV